MAEHCAINQIIDSARNKNQPSPPRPVKEVRVVETNTEQEFTDFNISGTLFTVTHRLLSKYPESKLSLGKSLMEYWSKEKGAYYFDRDPALFNSVLNVFRYNVVSIPAGYSEVMFRKELRFWNMSWQELEVGCNLDLDENLEAEFIWIEGRIPPPPAAASHHAKRRFLVWCFLTDPVGPYTRHRKMSTAYAAMNVLLTVLYLLLFGLSTSPDYRAIRNETTGEWTIPVECQVKIDCFLDSEPVPWLDNMLLALIGYFLFETLLRITVCPSLKIYLKSFMNWSDIIATLCLLMVTPFYVIPIDQVAELHPHSVRTVSTLIVGLLGAQALRIFKIFQYATLVDGLMVMMLTLKASLKELGLLVIYLMMGMFIFSTLVTFVELHSASGIPNCLIGYWWAIITMTTVGYGDYYPETSLGYLVGVLCAVTGLIMTALPVAVIGSNFNLYWNHNNKRNKLRAIQRERSNNSISSISPSSSKAELAWTNQNTNF